ncbi:DNA-directed RNA polymerase I subunit, putative [Perkinsus marinus ATCC 50983]|uniref:DNA-directed RNA polymerase n=1 Tax=Perkinsus marinus (strain ATCC 50983 / TXsc) TaxID=423536 RepID=C5LX45_PERM5|nr:DNA-directed RNA polymerase I subunit, putative [Perkinsus marinus ATCC 50983]EEQ98697.1 DNA-directed RNA polymerase I subunit, putative [Perkinsus marinus ATCC 50983]|eukprot:XP_002765980.1 DNA-directed RNA polymerase I subunit, putative [Perkinsus marinus ATCC 50983]
MKYTHIELSPISMLSVIAGLTPFSNHNQSPRNMYQCQMLKQTMAIPYLNHPYRTDNKVYKITYPQFPMVRTTVLSEANFDVKPAGTNAIVAVIAHSGFDMEDALIISKGSYDRGFKHGSVYKTKVINCPPKGTVGSRLAQFRADNHSVKGEKVVKDLDYDGIPYIGQQVHEGDPICRVLNKGTGEAKLEKYKEGEVAWVEQVNMIGGGGWWGGGAGARNPGGIKDGSERMSIKLRLPRNPVVGDKFSSRHGQKGVMAILWPQADMPFSTSGISPDIMFNPHGMPSRMTIGMLIEFMAGKAAALTGMPVVNANSFRQYRGKGLLDTEHNNEKDPYAPGDTTAHEYFGETLKKFGYEYLGAEELYSGMHGEPLKTHIYMGVVYYQRLRHMVLDKFQVRATGPIDPLTRQPVKGRKKHGGVRFGEMERDSLISHGTSALLADRLLKCSDACEDWVCPECGSILSYAHSPETVKRYSGREAAAQAPICRACSTERVRPRRVYSSAVCVIPLSGN